MLSKSIVALLAVVGGVSAQSFPASAPACASSCFTVKISEASALAPGVASTNIAGESGSGLCGVRTFIQAYVNCLEDNCGSATNVATSIALAQQVCASVGVALPTTGITGAASAQLASLTPISLASTTAAAATTSAAAATATTSGASASATSVASAAASATSAVAGSATSAASAASGSVSSAASAASGAVTSAASAASGAATSAASAAGSAVSSARSAAASVASAAGSAAAAATSKAASSGEKVVISGALGFIAGVVALLA